MTAHTGGRCPRCDETAAAVPADRQYPVTWHSDYLHDADGGRTLEPFGFTPAEILERDRLLKLTPAQLYEELCAYREQLSTARRATSSPRPAILTPNDVRAETGGVGE